jgi:two-component system KDP operon response regulator KdpE
MAVLRLGAVSVDLTARIARNVDGDEVRLTPIEYRILAVLARHSESIVTQATLLRDVWGPDRDDSGSLRVFIASLRRKLEADPSRPRHIITELGLGYRLRLDPEAGINASVG